MVAETAEAAEAEAEAVRSPRTWISSPPAAASPPPSCGPCCPALVHPQLVEAGGAEAAAAGEAEGEAAGEVGEVAVEVAVGGGLWRI
jgi:hypothetical protein